MPVSPPKEQETQPPQPPIIVNVDTGSEKTVEEKSTDETEKSANPEDSVKSKQSETRSAEGNIKVNNTNLSDVNDN